MYFILRTEIKLGKLQKLDSSSKVDDAGIKPPPPWKTNDVKVSNYDCQLTNSIRSLIQIKTTKIHTKFTSFLLRQSWIWMQQAMHPELNYNSYFRKKWVHNYPFKSLYFFGCYIIQFILPDGKYFIWSY